MSSIHNSPWPAQTPIAAASSPSPRLRRRSAKRRRIQNDTPLDQVSTRDGATSKVARQVVADQGLVGEALHNCQLLSGNDVFSCYPTVDTVIAQHQWATFVCKCHERLCLIAFLNRLRRSGNSRRPEITQTNRVDIFLFHGDSRRQILHYPNVTNPSDQAGSITAQVNDSWWGDNGDRWSGTNTSYPFYWVIIRSDRVIDGNEIPQATFTAVQTTYADSVLASMASSSASEASASSASEASASASASSASQASLTATVSTTSVSPSSSEDAGGGTTPGNVQEQSSGSSFPHWAIAVIVVLGFLAIAAMCILAFLIIRRIRRRNAADADSNRNSMGSASPMMAAANSPGSPLLAAAAIPPKGPSSVGHGGVAASADRGGRDGHSMISPDGASVISRTGSAGDPGPFSEKDAQIMADAFRKMLRRAPDDNIEEQLEEEQQRKAEADMHRELADEGRDIRSVSSSRGVRVEASDGTTEGPSHR
ncbi:hypothetical protein AX16_004967 [Volvariella volvacea WC 439]|nr:hypothetical protein AX16_004967 [Volvariella volvacea WC 439]